MKENLEELSAERCLCKATGTKRVLFSRARLSEESQLSSFVVKAQMRWKRRSGPIKPRWFFCPHRPFHNRWAARKTVKTRRVLTVVQAIA
jgi:hypothetical protein